MYLNNLLHRIRTKTFFVNCFVLLLVQATLNDIGNKQGGVVAKVHTQIGGSHRSVCLRAGGGGVKLCKRFAYVLCGWPRGTFLHQ